MDEALAAGVRRHAAADAVFSVAVIDALARRILATLGTPSRPVHILGSDAAHESGAPGCLVELAESLRPVLEKLDLEDDCRLAFPGAEAGADAGAIRGTAFKVRTPFRHPEFERVLLVLRMLAKMRCEKFLRGETGADERGRGAGGVTAAAAAAAPRATPASSAAPPVASLVDDAADGSQMR